MAKFVNTIDDPHLGGWSNVYQKPDGNQEIGMSWETRQDAIDVQNSDCIYRIRVIPKDQPKCD